MVTDPVANLINNLKTHSAVGKERVFVPYSNFLKNIAEVLIEEGLLNSLRL